jgi:hypothetical protein
MLKSLFTPSFKLALIVISLSFLFFSCKEKDKKSEAFFSKNISLSEKDLEKISENTKLKNLDKEHVLNWSNDVQMIDSTDKIAYLVGSFLKIDSLKKVGKYQKYVDSLDIGMVRDSRAFIIDTLLKSSDSLIVVWGIKEESYEACPWHNQISVFGTLIESNNFNKTIEIANSISMGDPPSLYYSFSEAKIKNKLIIGKTTIIKSNDSEIEDKLDTLKKSYLRLF